MGGQNGEEGEEAADSGERSGGRLVCKTAKVVFKK
jgi:hypothetical protein